jgi:hypothetical protein
MKLEVSLGITVFMQHCSFQAELSREMIKHSIKEIDTDLKSQGLKDTNSRISAVTTRIVGISELIAAGDIDQEEGVSEIAYAFAYAFVKEKGIRNLQNVRGLIGCLADDKLYLNPCADDKTYIEAADSMREASQEILGYDSEDMVDRTPARPTIH